MSKPNSEPPKIEDVTQFLAQPDTSMAQVTGIPTVLVGPKGLARDGLISILNAYRYIILDAIEDISELKSIHQPVLLLLTEFGQEQIASSAIPTVRAKLPAARIVVLTDAADPAALSYLLEMGVQACLNRHTQPSALIKSLNVVMGGNIVMSIEAVSQINTAVAARPRPALVASQNGDATSLATAANLSNREIEILACLADGQSNKLIGRQLLIAEATVKIHVKGILRKINVRNRTQAAVWVLKNGIPKAAPRRVER